MYLQLNENVKSVLFPPKAGVENILDNDLSDSLP